MAGKGGKPPKSSVSEESDSVSDKLLLDALLKIQASLTQNNNILQQNLNQINTRIDSVSQKQDELSKSVHGTDGIKSSVNELQETVGSNTDTIDTLQTENRQLRHELEIMKNIVIQTVHRVERSEEKIANLSVHNMKNNILIHVVAENESEVLSDSVPTLLKTELHMDVSFSSLYRMGNITQPSAPKGGARQKDPKPRIIVGRLSNPHQKSSILQAAKDNDNIRITSQYPEEMRDKRSRLYKVQDDCKDKEIPCQIKGDKLVFTDKKTIFREKVVIPTPEDVLCAVSDSNARKKLDKIKVTTGEVFKSQGNFIVSQACAAESFTNVRNFALKVLSDEASIPADSNVLVYRFTDNKGEIQEGWSNDREYGAGQGILKTLQDENVMNVAVVMSRKVGQHLGWKRHTIFQDNAMSAVNLLVSD